MNETELTIPISAKLNLSSTVIFTFQLNTRCLIYRSSLSKATIVETITRIQITDEIISATVKLWTITQVTFKPEIITPVTITVGLIYCYS